MDRTPIHRALLSVSDKDGLIPLARALTAHGAELLATGGTARALADAGIAHVDVAAHTGQREILGGRVKTLVAQIHGGILARRYHAEDMAALAAEGIAPIDLVCVNLYPFAHTVASGADPAACVENIDIGGPAMIRSAAKNFAHVCVLTEPAQYPAVIGALAQGGTDAELRRACAAAAFAHTAAYDAAIAAWFTPAVSLPATLTLAAHRTASLRYGENPHQQAALYATAPGGLPAARKIQGKALSFNNLADTDAALACVSAFDEPTIVIVKHGNPCGVATAPTLAAAWAAALRSDPQSAFGGVVAANRTLDAATAEGIAAIFTEVIAAPDATPDAQALLAHKKNVRLLLTGPLRDPRARDLALRTVWGGLLAQSRDDALADTGWRVVTQRPPTDAEVANLVFAARVAKHVMSNAIVYARDFATVGIGAGQMSRVDSVRIAAWKAEEAAKAEGLAEPRTYGAVVASDAFFPFADGLLAAIGAGATAVIQPGGSVRDAEVIAAADAAGISMVFNGLRHFRH